MHTHQITSFGDNHHCTKNRERIRNRQQTTDLCPCWLINVSWEVKYGRVHVVVKASLWERMVPLVLKGNSLPPPQSIKSEGFFSSLQPSLLREGLGEGGWLTVLEALQKANYLDPFSLNSYLAIVLK